jgi:membrane protease YdiL (CAAX protease family)
MMVQPPARYSPWIFFGLVFLLSMPLWLLGAFIGKLDIPINLPIGALGFVVPLIAAVILTYRERGSAGVKELLLRVVDFRKIKEKRWYFPIFLIWPVTLALEYGIMLLTGTAPADAQFPILMAPVFFVVFFIGAIGEEVGWSGFLIDRLQVRWSASADGLLIGTVWGIWHIVPMVQAHNPPTWIFWQCLGMVPLRVLFVWLYNNTGKSVFGAIVFHDMANVSQFLFPNYGSHYDPFIACIILAGIALIAIFLCGPQTLARYRYARVHRSDASV